MSEIRRRGPAGQSTDGDSATTATNVAAAITAEAKSDAASVGLKESREAHPASKGNIKKVADINVELPSAQKQKTPMRRRRSTFIFFLGSLFGIVAAGFFAKNNDLIDFPELGDLSIDSLYEALPSALPAGLVSDVRDLLVSSI